MSFLQQTWKFVGGSAQPTAKLIKQVRSELFSLLCSCPLFQCNLSAKISGKIVATDASETGGAVGAAEQLTWEGMDFATAEQNEMANEKTIAPILILSLFNGIGGCFRCYDMATITPLGRIAVELDDRANRITSRRWPGTLIVKDVKLIDDTMVRQWSLQYLRVKEVHLWGGFPCVDLSRVKHNRENLLGPQSSLFWEIPRVRKLLEKHFGVHVEIKTVVENVASMDRSATEEISAALGTIPYRLDCMNAVPMRRPRYCWTSEQLENLMPGVTVSAGQYWREVEAHAPYPEQEDWVENGFVWKGGLNGEVLPTCMKSIPRTVPPPKPAGLEKTSPQARQRWIDDSYRYPPYQYQDRFIFTSADSWRLVNANEKELLLGYGHRHTALAWATSRIKQNPAGYSDARNSYLGDSFSIYSFIILAVACCRKYLPVIPYSLLVRRLGLAPGYRSSFRSFASIGHALKYGSAKISPQVLSSGCNEINRLLLHRTNHTGSDIRIVSGEIMNSKTFPRQSICSQWWKWKEAFRRRWQKRNHINVLELEALLLGKKYQIHQYKATDMRIFQICDSYVSISVFSKGRSSSWRLQRVLNHISALLRAHGLHLVLAHVESSDNPTDKGSRM